MIAHSLVMHKALRDGKRLLHTEVNYYAGMNDPAARLRIARLRAGYSTGKEAAEALGIPIGTYLGHENGSRGISAARAAQYAKRYKIAEQWLLYGVGEGPGQQQTGESAEVVSLIEHMSPIRRTEALRILRVLAGNGDG